MGWRENFAIWKQRYDISASFLGIINFMLLSITASPYIQNFFKERLNIVLGQFSVIILLVLFLIFVLLGAGLILEKVFHFWENLMTVQNNQNPHIDEILRNTRELLKANNKRKR